MALAASTQPPPRGIASNDGGLRVPARWLPVARIVWLSLTLLGAILIGASLPRQIADLRVGCATPECPAGWQLPATGMAQWRVLGLTGDHLAAFVVAIELTVTLVYVGTSGLLVWRRTNEWMALFTAFFLLTFGIGLLGEMTAVTAATAPIWNGLARFLGACGTASLIIFLLFFPDDRLRPRWLWAVVAAWCAVWLPGDLFPDSAFAVAHWPPILEPLLLLAFFGLAIGTQVWRFRCRLDNRQRRRAKWVLYGLTVLLVCHLSLYPGAVLVLGLEAGTPIQVAIKGTITLLFTLIPLSVTLAILRERLWDIDLVINRSLVYGGLTAAIVALYILIVGGIGTALGGQGGAILPFAAAAIIAIVFQPLRAWLQRRVNRLFYGERDDPYAALARLGRRLEGTLTPETALPTIVQVVREALRLPYAAIILADAPGGAATIAAGDPAPTALRLPLLYGQERVGELRLAERAPGELFSAADRRLLAEFARQAGVAVHAARLSAEARELNAALQESRERLVTAREEERRRLRRDLHDGLGPQLAGFTLRLDVAKGLLRDDPATAERIIGDLSDRTQEVTSEIRRLVYALRPPALDELGLIGALRQYATVHDSATLRMTIEATAMLPTLPAAVEVAALRIAQEALTNAQRHANARSCTVAIRIDDGAAGMALHLAITDDGRGIEPSHRAGVGLRSMRERAEELGGRWGIESAPGEGTSVRAWLPLPGQGGDQQSDVRQTVVPIEAR